jgi:hypothetical protein
MEFHATEPSSSLDRSRALYKGIILSAGEEDMQCNEPDLMFSLNLDRKCNHHGRESEVYSLIKFQRSLAH